MADKKSVTRTTKAREETHPVKTRRIPDKRPTETVAEPERPVSARRAKSSQKKPVTAVLKETPEAAPPLTRLT